MFELVNITEVHNYVKSLNIIVEWMKLESWKHNTKGTECGIGRPEVENNKIGVMGYK